MYKILISITFLLFVGCAGKSLTLKPINDYKALGNITQNGSAVTPDIASKLNGKKVKLWGYIDKEGTSTCGLRHWKIAIKATKSSSSSNTINIHTPAKYSFSDIYHKIFDNNDNCLDKPILITGTLTTFPLVNFSSLVGIEITVDAPSGIKFK
jgi:hypothetical protein